MTSPNATVNVTGTNTVLGATTIDIKPGGNNTIMTTNGSGVVTWVPTNTIDTAMIAGSNISIVRNAGGNTISATDTAMIAGTGIGITRSASGNTIAVTGGNSSVTSPNATINVSGTNTVLGATTIDIKAGGNNTVMTTNGSGSVTWAPVSSLGDNLGNHTATQRLNMNNFSVYGADTLIANKARLTALTAGAATDSILTVNTATGDVRRISIASVGDNLGNHTATQRLNMSSKSIYGADTLIARNAQLSNLQSGSVADSIVTVNPATGDIRKVSASAMVGTVNIKRVTANYTLTTTDNILIVNAPASSTITITVPTTPAGRTYTIKRVDDNVATVNIVFSGGAVVDETDTQISVGNRVSYQIAEEDATHWHTISRF